MKTIKKFKHINASTIDEVVSNLRKYGDKASVIAGGTDLLGTMRFEILNDNDYPEAVVNLKTIPGLDFIKEEDGILKIGALTRLEDIATNSIARNKYAALSEAAGKTASPHIREMGTIGGNICQLIRCWYFRKEDNRFDCTRKGGKRCYAITGDARYHSIFGSIRVGCTPCSSECPNNVNIPDYMSKIREGKTAEAAQILMEHNPLAAMTGRVCPHFCESGCNRSEYDEAVSVRGIERFLGDYMLTNSAKMYKAPRKENNKTVAVVGSGPSGLTAAYFLRCLGYKVTILESQAEPGGLLMYGIPSYRLPKDIVRKQVKVLEDMGIELKLNTEETKIEKLAKKYDAVYVATGAWKERTAGTKGEDLFQSGAEFLREANLGSKKAPGKKVAVMGGGNVAIDVARTLLRMGSEPVIIYRRGKAEMPALKDDVIKTEEEGIQIQFLTLPIEAVKKGKKIALECAKMKLGPLDESGRPRPIQIKGSEFITEYDVVLTAIGETPDTSILPKELVDEKGRAKIDMDTYSMGKNIFAGGDFATGPATVVEAMAAGRKAAGSINTYLGGKDPECDCDCKECTGQPDSFNSDYLKKTVRVEAPELSVAERIKSLNIEEAGGLKLSEVKNEANRCFNCGCVAVNPSDMAAALVALDAKIVTSSRTIEADDFWAADQVVKSTLLENDEFVTEIQIPEPLTGVKSAFLKFAIRKTIDFPIVNVAAAIKTQKGVVKSARICLNAVYCNPYRVTKAEDYMLGKSITVANAEAAADAAMTDAIALPFNKYKIQVAKAMVKRAILACK
jgi:NADPH-dependent glutamate synthase beta subunit-like oxidoreductase/CO/xanthine dehydrogenase FAD-binding subunit